MANLVVKTNATLTNKEPSLDNLESVTFQMVAEGEKVSSFDQTLSMGMAGHMSLEFGHFFEEWDLLLSPTFIQGTPKIGSPLTLNSKCTLDEWFEEASRFIPGTPIANMTGLPAISIPCAIGPGGLPLGMHFFSGMGKERILIDIARQLEESDPWIDRHPSIYVISKD